MVKWGTAYPTSRRNFFLITFNWVANALVWSPAQKWNKNVTFHFTFPYCHLQLDHQIGSMLMICISFHHSISCYKVYNGLSYKYFHFHFLLSYSRCIMDWATTLQTSMWAHTWASSSALPLRLAFILGFQQIHTWAFRFHPIFWVGGSWTSGVGDGFFLRRWW